MERPAELRPRPAPERPRAERRSASRFLDDATAPEMERKADDDDEPGDHAAAEQSVVRDRVRGRLAGVVRDERDRHRPRDSAERVPEEEAPPRHVRESGDPRAGDAKAAEPARQEDRLAAV